MIEILTHDDLKRFSPEKIQQLASIEHDANYHGKLSTEQIESFSDEEYQRYVDISNLAERCFFTGNYDGYGEFKKSWREKMDVL